MTNIILPEQPIGAWKRRGASSFLIDVALGQDPSSWSFEQDSLGYTTWHYWAQSPHPETTWQKIQCLDPSSANICAKDGEHPLYRLLLRGCVDAALLWLRKNSFLAGAQKEKDTYWHALAWSGKPTENFFSYLPIEELDKKDSDGLTPVIISAHRGGPLYTQEWLFLGADPEQEDNTKKNLLHHIAMYGDISWFTSVQDCGGDEKHKNDRGQTAHSVLVERMKNADLAEAEIIKTYWLKRYQNKLFF